MDKYVNAEIKKTGLVLCGGGAKGAYQIGVWEYLRSRGMDKEIGAVSGASVGALNALLIAQGNIAFAKKTWLQATPDAIMAQRRLKALVEESLYAWDKASAGQMSLYACVSDVTSLPLLKGRPLATPHYINLNGLSRKECIETVLASSAVPLIVPSVNIRGMTCIDGGIADNIPVRPLIESGYKKILVVHLDPDTPLEDLAFKNAVRGLDTKDVAFSHIYPRRSHSVVDFFSLYTSHSGRLMQDGYRDACAFVNER